MVKPWMPAHCDTNVILPTLVLRHDWLSDWMNGRHSTSTSHCEQHFVWSAWCVMNSGTLHPSFPSPLQFWDNTIAVLCPIQPDLGAACDNMQSTDTVLSPRLQELKHICKLNWWQFSRAITLAQTPVSQILIVPWKGTYSEGGNESMASLE